MPSDSDAPIRIDQLADEELVAKALDADEVIRGECLEELYGRYRKRVAAWCLRFCNRREEAADLAQEVFLRIHTRLHTFRSESRFSTWLYTVMRSVAINRGRREKLRRHDSLDEPEARTPVDPAPGAEESVERRQLHRRFREAMERDLDPLEAKVLYLHYVDGLTLAAVTELLELRNKSGAKKYIVSAKRKMKRRFGRWLERELGGEETGR